MAVQAELDLLGLRRFVGLERAAQRAAQLKPQVAVHQAQQIERRSARGRLDVAAGAAGEMQDVEILVGDDIGRRIALGDALGAPLQADIGADAADRRQLDRRRVPPSS